jgi:endonuclease-3
MVLDGRRTPITAACERPVVAQARVSPGDVIEKLGKEYGPFEWRPRYDPASELVYSILSQHTSDVNSARAFDSLMKTFGSLESIARADIARIEGAIRTAGLFRVKAPRIKAILSQLLAEVGSFDLSFLGEMPLEDAKAWLKRLNGIGPKTAAVILCFALGMPAMPVDTHIFRVAKRLGFLGPKDTADQAHDILESMVQPEDVYAFHLSLINHGRRVCKSLRPRCDRCVLAGACPSRHIFWRAAGGVSGGRSARPAPPVSQAKRAGSTS